MTRPWLQLLMAFFLGAVVGVVGARWSAWHGPHRHWEGKQAQSRMLKQFSSKLHLTSDQRTQVAAILEAKHQKIEALRTEIRPRFEEIRASTSAEIRQRLTPEQQQRFDVMETAWRQKMTRGHGQRQEGTR